MPRKRKRHPKTRPTAPLISESIREQYFFLPATLLLAGFAYFTTLCPTVYVGDSGELAAASYYLGIPHSPGYPLYCLIGWVFAHLPFGPDVAYRLNMMSAVFALATVLILYLIIYHFTRTPYLSFSISLAYAFSPIFWSQAVVAEVYSLNTFLTALSLYFLCRWLEKRHDHWLYLAFFAMGIAVANHQLAVLLLPTGVYLLWLFGKGLKKPARFWATLAALYILGLLVYLYLPIRAAADPPLNWGDPDSLQRFLATVFTPAGAQTAHGSRWVHFIHVLKLWTMQFSPFVLVGEQRVPIPIIWVFGIWGIYKGLSTGWRMARVFVFFVLLNVAAILFVSRPTEQELMLVGVYYLPVFLVFAVFMATGIREWLQQYLTAFGKQKRPVLLGLVILILVLIPEYQYFQNRPDADRSKDYYARDYGATLLNACPPDAILLVNWDDIFTLWYLQKVEGLRTDVIPILANLPSGPDSSFWGDWYLEELMERYPDIFEGSGIGKTIFRRREDAIAAFVTANLNRGRDVFFSFYGLDYNFELFTPHFKIYPMGPVYRATFESYNPADLVRSRDSWEHTIEEFRNLYTYYDHLIEEEDFIITRLSTNLWNTGRVARNLNLNMAIWFFDQARMVDKGNLAATIDLAFIHFQREEYTEARNLLVDAREINPWNPDVHLLLGHLYKALDQNELARKSLERVLEIDPDHPEARALLEQLRDN